MANSNNNMIPLQQPPKPVLNPQIAKDLMAYLEAMEMLEDAKKKLKAMAANLSNMKNVMFGVMEIMNMFQNVEGDQVNALSSVDNIDSDLRSQITGGQNSVNDFQGSKNQTAEMQKLIDFVNEMQNFIDAKGGAKGVIDDSTLKNLQAAVNTIKAQFTWPKGSAHPGENDWGNAKKMAYDMSCWEKGTKNGTYPYQIKNIQNGFQELTQTTSALSTTTNTNLQYTTEMLKQYLGIDNTAMQSYQKGNAQLIQNQKSS